MANILTVGNATLDIIHTVDRYPAEDEEVRALDRRRARGGNAANTAVVLSQLGHRCGWAGTLAEGAETVPITDDLHRFGIDTSAAETFPRGRAPISHVVLSRETGSRTIVHYRDLPEYSREAFRRIDLTHLDWVHFEGRNVEEVGHMLLHLKRLRPELPCSLELEKPSAGVSGLFAHCNLLLCSRALAGALGEPEPRPFLERMRRDAPAADIVTGWGAQGAYALSREGVHYEAPALAPPRVVDTLGAGDVLNAGVIDGRLRGLGLELALVEAVRLAGRKCGQHGLDQVTAG